MIYHGKSHRSFVIRLPLGLRPNFDQGVHDWTDAQVYIRSRLEKPSPAGATLKKDVGQDIVSPSARQALFVLLAYSQLLDEYGNEPYPIIAGQPLEVAHMHRIPSGDAATCHDGFRGIRHGRLAITRLTRCAASQRRSGGINAIRALKAIAAV